MRVHVPSLVLLTLLMPAFPALAADRAAAPDQPGPDPVESLRAELRQEIQTELRQLPELPSRAPQEAVQFRRIDRDLQVQSALAMPTPQSKLQLKGMPGWATISVQGAPGGGAGAAPFVQLIHRNLESPGAVLVMTSVFAGPANLQVVRDIQRPDAEISICLIQNLVSRGTDEDDKVVQFYVTSIDPQSGLSQLDIRASAASFADLMKQHPKPMGEYFRPIFRDLGQDVTVFGQQDAMAWQVFAPVVEADPAAVKQVNELVKQLDAELLADREAANAALRALGRPGAIALLKMNRQGLSEEQNTRIDAVLEAYHALTPEQAKTMLQDRRFLLDTLECDDAVLRRLAAAQLDRVVGRKLEIDLDAPVAQRRAALEPLRRQLLTTQPAANP